MMATVSLDDKRIKVPIHRLNVSTKEALSIMHEYDRDKGIKRKPIGSPE
jgi:hypothetical protein